jgi:hypothetical protein
MPQDWRAFALLGLGVGIPAFVSYAGVLPTPSTLENSVATGSRE